MNKNLILNKLMKQITPKSNIFLFTHKNSQIGELGNETSAVGIQWFSIT
jgi:hypothetical protein